MNEDEKIKLRIAAAKILGYDNPTQSQDGTWYGHYGGARLKSPLPDCLDNAADCEALLVATESRGYKIVLSGGVVTFWHNERNQPSGYITSQKSDNPDPRSAYREAVTCCCVAAWQAEEGGEEK